MRINKYQKISNSKYRLFLSNGEVIDTYANIILEQELLTKKELTLSTYNKILNDTIIYEKYDSCLKYIQVRVRSEKEIRDYLKRKKADQEEIIIEKLINSNYLNDDYFAKCFINDKLKFTSWGPYKVINELKKHNINNEIINKYSYLLNDELIKQKLEKLINKKISANHKLDNVHLKNKLYNNFLKLGYESSMILTILNNIL